MYHNALNNITQFIRCVDLLLSYYRLDIINVLINKYENNTNQYLRELCHDNKHNSVHSIISLNRKLIIDIKDY